MLRLQSHFGYIKTAQAYPQPQPSRNYVEEWKQLKNLGKRISWTNFFNKLSPEEQPIARQQVQQYNSNKAKNNPGSFKAKPKTQPTTIPFPIQPQNQTEPESAPPMAAQPPQSMNMTSNDPSFDPYNDLGDQPFSEPATPPQTPTPQVAPQPAVNPQQLAQNLQQAIKNFGNAYNAQIKPYNVAIKSIHKIIQALSNEQNLPQNFRTSVLHQISGNIQSLIDQLNQATQSVDTQLISQMAQTAQTVFQAIMGTQYPAKAAMLTPRIATASSLILRR